MKLEVTVAKSSKAGSIAATRIVRVPKGVDLADVAELSKVVANALRRYVKQEVNKKGGR